MKDKTNCEGACCCCEGDYNSLDMDGSPNCGYGELTPLNIDANGFYSYSVGSPTKFKRSIQIGKGDLDSDGDDLCPIERLSVTVTVFWEEKRGIKSISVVEELYDWHEYPE